MKQTRGTLLVRSFSEEEEDLLIKLHALLGNRYEERAMVLSCSTQLWPLIAGRLPGRTDKEVKNHWNSQMRTKLKSMGVDPDNHRAKTLPLPDHEQRRRAINECEEHRAKHSDRDPSSSSKDDIAVGDCAVSDASSSSNDRARPEQRLAGLNLDLTLSTPCIYFGEECKKCGQ